MNVELTEVVGRFRFEGQFIDAMSYGSGHINRTYVLRFVGPAAHTRRYLLQKINRSIFRDPAALMANVAAITRHLWEKICAAGGDPLRETLNLRSIRDGAWFHREACGRCWRAYLFIEGAGVRDGDRPQHIYSAARTLGNFQF